jgi:hypothetical protein
LDIVANVRPRGLKRGRGAEKKLAAVLGFEDLSLRNTVGRLELSASRPEDFFLLAALFKVLHPWMGSGGKITIEPRDSKPMVMTFARKGSDEGQVST